MTKSAPSETKDKPPTGLGTVMVRNEFYRDGYRTLLRVVLVQALVIAGLIGLTLFVLNTKQKEYVYFATTQDGRNIPMLPLSHPNLSDAALLSWVAQSTSETMTFGFNDYKRRLQESRRHFTTRGWGEFTKALQVSGLIEKIEANRQVLTAVPAEAPIMESQGSTEGRYQWIVQMPLALTYQSGNNTDTQKLVLRLVIVRQDRLESINGVGIEQLVYAR